MDNKPDPSNSDKKDRCQDSPKRHTPSAMNFDVNKYISQKLSNVPSINNRLNVAVLDTDLFNLNNIKIMIEKIKKQQQDYVLMPKLYQFPKEIGQFKGDLERGCINGILTVQDMPVMTGLEVVKYVRHSIMKKINKIPILILNRVKTTPNPRPFITYEAHFAQKPIDYTEIWTQLIEPMIHYDQALKSQQNLKH
ncbi:TPA: hypothetical protein ACPSKB_003300 [Legionella feeleii]|uniref:Response regulatory domain-containing protein n=1 Tax=Legionella feeleii TaxID=453 RepID=A0A378J407_9GAMM|nr:hypothetical protein [Legionella feeleii]STX39024.1 Uncharacterised protein [Legionella feeleii]